MPMQDPNAMPMQDPNAMPMEEPEAPSPYDDIAPEMEGDQEEAVEGEEGYDYNNAMADMIHGHMEGGEGEGEEAPMEESGEGQGEEVLKDDIRSALMIFKQNKDILEQARQQSPEMYEATVTMLRAMIEMAKQLGYAPEQDIAEVEAQEEMAEGFPQAEEAEEAEIAEDAEQEEEEGLGKPPEKKP